MKVTDASTVSAVEMYAHKATPASTSAPSKLEDDHVQLSEAAKQLSMRSAAATPSTHDLKAIRTDIARGTYKIDHGRIADGIIADAGLSGARRGGARGN